jgi:hypothetical protein
MRQENEMSEYMFECGQGKVSKREAMRIDKIAKKHGAAFVTNCGPECFCGRNCGGCNHRYWFFGPNRGEPFDSQMARDIMAEVGEIKHK